MRLSVLSDAFRTVRARPATVGVVVVLLVVGILTISSDHRGLLSTSLDGVGPADLGERHWWALLTSTLGSGSVVQFVLALVAAIAGIGLAERLIGTRRTVIAFLVTGILATAIGVGLELLGAALGEFWSSSVKGLVTLDPLTPIAGTVAWASGWATPFWRRRLRVTLVAGAVALLLYSGEPADLYLLVAIGIGVLGGRVQRPSTARFWRGTRHELRGLLALVTAILAVGPLLTLVSSSRFGVLSPLGIVVTDAAPRGVSHAASCVASRLGGGCVGELTTMHLGGIGATSTALFPLVLMLVSAWGLRAGRRAAVWVLVVLGVAQSLLAAWYFGILPAAAAGSAASSVPGAVPGSAASITGAPPPGHDIELGFWLVVSTVVPLADALLLLGLRGLFPVRMTVVRRRAFLLTLLGAVLVPSGLYLGIGWALRAQFRPQVTDVGALLTQLPERIIPVSFLRHVRLDFVAATPATHLLLQLVGPLFWVIVIAGTVFALRTQRGAPLQAQEVDRIRGLLARGSGTLGQMTTWAGNRLWESSDGRFGIAYRVVGGFAVTTSDPIGESPDPEQALTEFLRFCDRAAWTPVFYSVHEEWRSRLEQRGWTSVPVAEETVLDPRTFTLEGKAMHDIRYAVNRAAREGVRSLWGTWSTLPPRILRQIAALSEGWMSDKDLPELGFTLGGLDEMRDPDVLVGVAADADGTVLAVTSWLPARRHGVLVGRTLDVMRRGSAAGNGVMEFLIADAVQRFAAEGLESASLSGSPLARPVDDIAGGGVLTRVLALVGGVLEPVYGFRSLLRFKRKFSPRLEPMHLVLPDPLDLPAVGLAIARCYLPTLTVAQATRAFTPRR